MNKTAQQSTMNDWFKPIDDKTMEIPPIVYKYLPPTLRTITDCFAKQQQKDVILLASIVAISGILPHYETHYMHNSMGANLYAYFYGQFGSDKGLITLAERLLMPIHREKRERTKQRQYEYNRKMRRAISAKKRKIVISREEDHGAQDAAPLMEPLDELLLIPANNTKASLIKQLLENNGHGVIIETEADTLSIALKQEHGGFADALRKAYHHERITAGRKAEGTTEIEHPRLTVIITSTPKQILRLMPDIEDGLFSRFFYWRILPTPEFYNAADECHKIANQTINDTGERLKLLYNWLEVCAASPVTFELLPKLVTMHYNLFSELKQRYHEVYEGKLDGVINRFGVMFYRICGVLAILRQFDECGERSIIQEVICKASDFTAAKHIVLQLIDNSITTYELLTVHRASLDSEQRDSRAERDEKIRRSKELHKQGYSVRQIAAEVLGKEDLCGTISKWLRK